ncbi:N-acetylneuraminate synthase [Rheinheimera tangshanensis]|uniref:N-acetylneuraminate synthase n=1 Tax=Rheinheimera tangshanensis TaxID=400153 RepID=A0A5C8LXV3_9GAMM|nr:N-acetylneuraminate synthase [Rheinheimera tangshanensis]TXK80428.1 N-acetylneuraminate synthase [Rheinheimera tangshanensis]GGM61380.1 N-acetylneuraminate synthase [Rheinheimera tangshanensis]
MIKIIAEAGVNHNGSEELAFKLIDAAFEAGADIVKFQTFKAANLVTKTARQAEYQTANTGKNESQFAMLSRLELSYQTHHRLLSYCQKLGIEFLSTAFDSESLKFLTEDLNLKTLKIPSGELTNAPFLLEHAQTGADLILSTGMSTLGEIEQALGVIAFGLLGCENLPSPEAFQTAYSSSEGQALLQKKVTILHCTTEYPAPLAEINLKAIDTLAAVFNLKAGYSDHSEGIIVPIAAAARGACLIEKHYTLDRNMDGPDHKASLEPDELKAMVKAIRDIEKILGDGRKVTMPSELKNRSIARKSLVAQEDIKQGECFNEKNLGIKRSGDGLSPYLYWQLLGKTARRAYLEGASIID